MRGECMIERRAVYVLRVERQRVADGRRQIQIRTIGHDNLIRDA